MAKILKTNKDDLIALLQQAISSTKSADDNTNLLNSLLKNIDDTSINDANNLQTQSPKSDKVKYLQDETFDKNSTLASTPYYTDKISPSRIATDLDSCFDDINSIFRKSLKVEQSQRKYRSKEEQSKKFACKFDYCLRDYATKQALKVHMRKEHGIVNYEDKYENITKQTDPESIFSILSIKNKDSDKTDKDSESFMNRKRRNHNSSEDLLQDSANADWKEFLVEHDNDFPPNKTGNTFNVNCQWLDEEDVIGNLDDFLITRNNPTTKYNFEKQLSESEIFVTKNRYCCDADSNDEVTLGKRNSGNLN